MRSFAVTLALALLAATPAPVAPAGDRVAELVGTWTCRSPYGNLSTVSYRAEGGRIAATETSADRSVAASDDFTPISSGGWSVEHSGRYSNFSGYAPAWTTGTWVITESRKHGAEIRYERIDDRTLRRTFMISGHAPLSGEVCARGDTPPDPALCAVRDLPATVVKPIEPDTPPIAQQQHVSGVVDVLVSLDAAGRVLDATIAKSRFDVLNASATAAARGSTYRPALHNCKGIPSTYTFRVEFNSQ